jgi:type I restriction enzyme S subunit
MRARLADVVDFNPAERLPKGTAAKKVSMDKLSPFARDIPAWEVAPYGGGAKFCNGDTIMARITPCLENGKTAQVNILNDGEVGYGSTEFIVWRAKDGVTDRDFIYYLSQSPGIRDVAVKSMVGSSGRQRVQQTVLDNYVIDLPLLEEQIEIGRTLSALDDRIENNAKINNHLTGCPAGRAATSATDSSPDMRRGRSVSRKVARRADSCSKVSRCLMRGSIIS